MLFSIHGICAIKMAKDAAVPILKIIVMPFKWIAMIIGVVPWFAWKVWRMERAIVD